MTQPLQHAKAYGPLKFRTAFLPIANIGSRFGPLAAIFGISMGVAGLTQVGILLFLGAVLFQLITLPVEFDASQHALKQLETLGLSSTEERSKVKRVLSIAAMTYVGAAATSLGYLIFYIFASRRRNGVR